MKKFIVLVATVSAMMSSPAFASGEGYVKARISADTTKIEIRDATIQDTASLDMDTDAGYGVALGYDLDFGDTAFVGAEVGVDFNNSEKRFGDDTYSINFKSGRDISVVGRAGFKTGGGKFYGLAGYSNVKLTVDDTLDPPISSTQGGLVYGFGASYQIQEKVGVSLEYRKTKIDFNKASNYLIVDDLDKTKSRIVFGLSYGF
jgi:opacity protein-like surface antigen